MCVNITLQKIKTKKKVVVTRIGAQHTKIKANKVLYLHENFLMKIKLKIIMLNIQKFKCICQNISLTGLFNPDDGALQTRHSKNTF